jgi:hypothetical protein
VFAEKNPAGLMVIELEWTVCPNTGLCAVYMKMSIVAVLF